MYAHMWYVGIYIYIYMLTSAAPQEHVFFFNGEFRAISHNAPQRGYGPQETFARASLHSIIYAALASQTA